VSPTNPIAESTHLSTQRTPQDGERRRNPQAAAQFQRALAEQGDSAPDQSDEEPAGQSDPETPTARKLQLGLGSGRKHHGSHSQHVDVVA